MENVVKLLAEVGGTKQYIFRKTIDIFEQLKTEIKTIVNEISIDLKTLSPDVEVEVKEQGKFEIDLKAGSDTIVFVMHTNVFHFPPDAEIHQNPMVQLDYTNAYCGMILFYDFLSDTFKYNRFNDPGFLIGRIFINKNGNFFIQGKKQFSYMYPTLTDKIICKEILREIILAAITNAIEFDTLAPPFDAIKEISYLQKIQGAGNSPISTSKRLGYAQGEF